MTTKDGTGTLKEASERLRSSARWLIASFGAVGAVLVSGLSLSQFGHLAGHRFWWAVAGIVLAFLGIATAVGAAGSIVTQSFATLKDVRDHPRKYSDKSSGVDFAIPDEVLLGGFESVGQLYDGYVDAIRDSVNDHLSSWEDPENTPLQGRGQASGERAIFIGAIQSNVLDLASYLRLKKAFRRVWWVILAGSGVTVFGVVLYVWASTSPGKAVTAPPIPALTPVRIEIVRTQSDEFSAILGPGCDLHRIDGVVIATVGQTDTVAILPRNGCTGRVIKVSPSVGSVLPQRFGTIVPSYFANICGFRMWPMPCWCSEGKSDRGTQDSNSRTSSSEHQRNDDDRQCVDSSGLQGRPEPITPGRG